MFTGLRNSISGQWTNLAWAEGAETLKDGLAPYLKGSKLQLRAKLRAIDAELEPIQTHRGIGYSIGRL